MHMSPYAHEDKKTHKHKPEQNILIEGTVRLAVYEPRQVIFRKRLVGRVSLPLCGPQNTYQFGESVLRRRMPHQ